MAGDNLATLSAVTSPTAQWPPRSIGGEGEECLSKKIVEMEEEQEEELDRCCWLFVFCLGSKLSLEEGTQQTDSADRLNEEEKRGTDTTVAVVVGGAVSSVNDCSWFTAFFPTSGERTDERTPVGEARETKRERKASSCS